MFIICLNHRFSSNNINTICWLGKDKRKMRCFICWECPCQSSVAVHFSKPCCSKCLIAKAPIREREGVRKEVRKKDKGKQKTRLFEFTLMLHSCGMFICYNLFVFILLEDRIQTWRGEWVFVCLTNLTLLAKTLHSQAALKRPTPVLHHWNSPHLPSPNRKDRLLYKSLPFTQFCESL